MVSCIFICISGVTISTFTTGFTMGFFGTVTFGGVTITGFLIFGLGGSCGGLFVFAVILFLFPWGLKPTTKFKHQFVFDLF